VTPFHISDEAAPGGIRVVLVVGYVDFEGAPRLKEFVARRIDAGSRHLVVDLSAVGFIDSTGLGVLVGAFKRLRESGGSLAVVCADEHVRYLFEVVGLDDLIPLHRSRADAFTALAAAA
jgi:anti-sigma B factor antagonist